MLVDFERYAQWNPFTVRVQTSGRVGDPVLLDVLLGGKRMRMREGMRLNEPLQAIGWGLHIGGGRLLDCTRVQKLEELASERTLDSCHESFRGLLVPLFFRRYEARMQQGFEAVASALKRRVEAMNGQARA